MTNSLVITRTIGVKGLCNQIKPIKWQAVACRPGGGGGGILEILSGGVPPGSPNPDPTSDKSVIFHTRSSL